MGMLVVNQRIRRDSLLIDKVRVSGDFAPDGDGVDDEAAIRFRVREDEKVQVQLLDSSGDEVRRLERGKRVHTDDVIELKWDGRDDESQPVEPGLYSLRIILRARDREITPGERILLEAEDD